MFDSGLFQVFLLFLTCAGIRCNYFSDYNDDDLSVFYDPCKKEMQTELTEIKSEVQTLQEMVVALRQKLDPDFKWPPLDTTSVHERPIKAAADMRAKSTIKPNGFQALTENWLRKPSPETFQSFRETAILSSTVKENEICPPGFKYLELAGGCYKVVYENHNWVSANRRCSELHAGAHLAAITTADENKAIKTFLTTEHSKNAHRAANMCRHPNWISAGKIVWTSGQLRNVSSCAEPFVWKVSNGTQLPLSYTNWDSTEPNCRNDEERCLSLAPVTSYRWNDLSCDIAICPLCEYNPDSDQ